MSMILIFVLCFYHACEYLKADIYGLEQETEGLLEAIVGREEV